MALLVPDSPEPQTIEHRYRLVLFYEDKRLIALNRDGSRSDGNGVTHCPSAGCRVDLGVRLRDLRATPATSNESSGRS